MAERGQQEVSSGADQFNAVAFLIDQMCGRLNTATLVKVVAVENDGGVAATGFVDLQPLVNMVDGNKNATPHGVIHGVPYFRLQGGANAVIIDPVVGDIGMAVFADHDIDSVVANQAASNPGSGRRFSMRDALYVGGFINAVPQQYLRFHSAGIELRSTDGAINIQAPDGVTINGVVFSASGAVAAPDVVSAPNMTVAGKSVNGHNHDGQVPGF